MTLSPIHEKLHTIIASIETLEIQKTEVMDNIKFVYNSARHEGLDPPIIRKIIALRKKEAEEIATEEALLALYKQALGM